jgi:hypothetical protein
MLTYSVGTGAVAAALGLAVVLPMWMELLFIAVALLVIAMILRAVGGPRTRRSEGAPLAIPAQRSACP